MISLRRLAEAYQHFGYNQVAQHPFTFENGDGEMYFHCPTPNNLLVVSFVIEDIATWNEDFAQEMREYLLQNPDNAA